MIKRLIIVVLFLGAVFGGIFWFQHFKGQMMMGYMAAGANPPQTVSTMKVEATDWQPEIKVVGSTRAVKGADLAAEVNGIVDRITFESGEDAVEGQVLLQLRDADDLAKLESLKAATRLAEITLDRDTKQLKAQAVSQATVDQDTATLNAARASQAEQEAILAKKTITAPFAGKLGVRQVDQGQYLNAGTSIVTLQQLDPIYIDFNLPEQDLPTIQVGQKITAHSDAHPDKVFDGEIKAFDAKIDPATRNVLIRATLKNPEHLLLPGMFANLSIASGAQQHLITVPQTAITYNPYGNTIFVVEQKGTDEKGHPKLVAKQSFVTTGETRGDQVAVLTGLKEGDEIVTAGQIKLQNGTPLAVNNDVQPLNDSNPKPVDQ
jgi:membrane fusion protein (multidrug efflux system)